MAAQEGVWALAGVAPRYHQACPFMSLALCLAGCPRWALRLEGEQYLAEPRRLCSSVYSWWAGGGGESRLSQQMLSLVCELCIRGMEASLPFFALPPAFFTCLEHLPCASCCILGTMLYSWYSRNSRNSFPCRSSAD